jgi:glycosyltransferase involved in cell wall biosynthesis
VKVLYLVPPARPAGAVAAHTFIAEEMAALARAGIRAYALTDEPTSSRIIDGVELVGVAPARSAASIAGTLAFAARHVAAVTPSVVKSSQARERFHSLRIEQAAAALVARERIDLIHSHFGWPGGFGGQLAAAHTRTPLVASIRGMDILTDPARCYGLRLEPGFDRAIRSLVTSADAVVTATGFMRRQAIALGAPASRVTTIAKGVCADTFAVAEDRPAAQAALGFDGPVVLAVGGLISRKGFDLLLNAIATVDRACTLVICGDGPARDALVAQAGALGIASKVHFAGQVPRAAMPRYFAAADVFVHPARLEAAGNVVLEALASECGVVITNAGGPGEFVRDGDNGLVVPVDDADGLAAAIRSLLDSPELRAALGRRARERILSAHSYPRMVADILAVYAAASCALLPAA